MSPQPQASKLHMRVSFDLDEVLFVSPVTHKTEPALRFPLNRIFRERLRLGTVRLIKELHAQGYEVWVYTSSFRSEKYIRRLFACYGVRFDGLDDLVKINDVTLRNCHFEGVEKDPVLQSGLVGTVSFENTTVNGQPL